MIVFAMSLFSISGYSATFQMEWGTVTTINEDWLQVNLDNTYTNPIVVVTPQYNFNPTNGIDSWVTNVHHLVF